MKKVYLAAAFLAMFSCSSLQKTEVSTPKKQTVENCLDSCECREIGEELNTSYVPKPCREMLKNEGLIEICDAMERIRNWDTTFSYFEDCWRPKTRITPLNPTLEGYVVNIFREWVEDCSRVKKNYLDALTVFKRVTDYKLNLLSKRNPGKSYDLLRKKTSRWAAEQETAAKLHNCGKKTFHDIFLDS